MLNLIKIKTLYAEISLGKCALPTKCVAYKITANTRTLTQTCVASIKPFVCVLEHYFAIEGHLRKGLAAPALTLYNFTTKAVFIMWCVKEGCGITVNYVLLGCGELHERLHTGIHIYTAVKCRSTLKSTFTNIMKIYIHI